MGCTAGKHTAAAPATSADATTAKNAVGGQTLLGNETGGGLAKKPVAAAAQPTPAAAEAPVAADVDKSGGSAPSAAAALALEAAGGPTANTAAHAEMAKATESGIDYADVNGMQGLAEATIVTHPIVQDGDEASPASSAVIQRCRKRKATPWVTQSEAEEADEPTGVERVRMWLLGTCCCNQYGENEELLEIEESP